MSALLYKTWLETRVRFLAGLAAVAIICIYYVQWHATAVSFWTQSLRDPRFSRSIWESLGIHDYGWYLWHYLYDNYLQQVWALFAVVLAFDGLIREKAGGTVSFSLGLPVSRRRWLLTRLAMVLIEGAALSLFAVLVVIVGSAVIHQTFPLSQMFLHAALMVAAGVFVIAIGNLCHTLFPGNYVSLLVTLAVLGAPYLWIQLYAQRVRITELMRAQQHMPMSIDPRWSLLGYFDLAHAMAGPWQLSLATTPWIALLVIWTLTALVLALTAAYGDRVDY